MAAFKTSAVQVRPATIEELAELQADLKKDKRWEQVDLGHGPLCVVTKNGEIVQYAHARLCWQIEPIKWVRGKKKLCNEYEQKKATYLCIRWLENWLRDTRNNPFFRFYFCHIHNPVMQKLALSFGMVQVYERGKFFGKDL